MTSIIDCIQLVHKYIVKVKLDKYPWPNILSEKMRFKKKERKSFGKIFLMQLFNGDSHIVHCKNHMWNASALTMHKCVEIYENHFKKLQLMHVCTTAADAGWQCGKPCVECAPASMWNVHRHVCTSAQLDEEKPRREFAQQCQF